MMKHVDLTNQSWTLLGWRPFSWEIGKSMEIGLNVPNDIPALPARVPGSAHTALLEAGWIKDWNIGLNSLQCEWVEHRHWEFVTEIPAGTVTAGEPVFLAANGLDHSGWILVDDKKVATFQGSLKRHRIDLSAQLSDGKAHRLGIVFDTAPREQGQVGFTVQSKHFKPRFSYGWDFCPRLVPVGIWDTLALEIGKRKAHVVRVFSSLQDNLSEGQAGVLLESEEAGLRASLRILHDGKEAASASCILTRGSNTLQIELHDVALWWPNGEGVQALYDLELSVEGHVPERFRVGFKQILWEPCEGAPVDALPWICKINGRSLFLQGVNWVPLQMDYASTPDSRYHRRIAQYKDMGCNVLRVWGGAFLEKSLFYDLCDEAGLLVWQEFPLCSSGIDNWPPEDPQAISEVCAIARDYVRRRGHHASKLLWCAGNELQHAEGSKTGVGIPVDLTHPCIAALAAVALEEDPGTRFLPASSSGPQFYASETNYGKGMHHDVHGPWNLESLEKWEKYWEGDDALLRSEMGMPGASSEDLVEKYRGDCAPWPINKTNPYFLHTNSWWLQWDHFQKELQDLNALQGRTRYVEASQKLQADALSIAVQTCRDRFPRCAGVLLWMGHDVFPCSANTSLIDFDGTPKPAYFALKEIFRRKDTPGLRGKKPPVPCLLSGV